MTQYCLWKNEEVKKLFNFIENYVKQGKSLSFAFKDYALSNNRKPNSVRNYYYLELNNLLNNEKRVNELEINLSLHTKKQANFFTEEEVKTQMQKLIELKNKGYSVRKACMTLANGNIEQMVRLQNKYRSILKNNPQYFESLGNNNIIKMPERKSKLSENDINNLFLGLVRLVKNQAKQEANLFIKKEKEHANMIFRQTLVDLANKEQEINSLRKQFEVLKNETKKLNETVKTLRTENTKLKSDKNDKLKKWIEKETKKQKKAN